MEIMLIMLVFVLFLIMREFWNQDAGKDVQILPENQTLSRDLFLEADEESKNFKESFYSKEWKLEEIGERIFLLTFKNTYDLGMTFLRAQEFYENVNPNFKGKIFLKKDFIEDYSRNNYGSFTYCEDWAGFNLTGEVLKTLYYENEIPDLDSHDLLMKKVVEKINSTVKEPFNFYLMGYVEGDHETRDHELAHSFYGLYPDYKKEMDNLMKKYPEEYDTLCEWLVDASYTKEVHLDEAQAYFSTGLLEDQEALFEEKDSSLEEIVKKSTKIFLTWKRKTKTETKLLMEEVVS